MVEDFTKRELELLAQFTSERWMQYLNGKARYRLTPDEERTCVEIAQLGRKLRAKLDELK